MPTELLESPVQALGRPIDIKGQLPDRIRNEFDNNIEILKPKPLTIEGNEELTKEFNDILERDFAYYSRTRDLEVNTERTQIIQSAVDKMAAGTGIETRVVIMRRGKNNRASVAPDGTIFVSQSLLNSVDTLDEVAAVVAHELPHLINKTSLRVTEAGTGGFGVGWVHEIASDQMAIALLEKAGFASWAFATAIEKIQGYERGTIHQSGLSRASQSVGQHLAIDRTTSSQEITPLPEILKEETVRTNLEIVIDRIKEEKGIEELIWGSSKQQLEAVRRKLHQRLSPLQPFIEKLHPRDFGEIYKQLVEGIHSEQLRKEKTACDQIIKERLEQAGCKTPEINLFLVRCRYPYYGTSAVNEADAYMFKEPKDLTEVVDFLSDGEADKKIKEMYHDLFDRASDFQLPTLLQLLEFIQKGIYDVNFEKNKAGLPVTRDTLLYSLGGISKLESQSTYEDLLITEKCCQILAKYISKTFLELSTEAETELDNTQLEKFFQEVREKGIKIDVNSLIKEIENTSVWTREEKSLPPDNKSSVIAAINKVFEVESFVLTTESINELSENFTVENVDKFLHKAQGYCEREGISDEQRLYFANYLAAKIDGKQFSDSSALLKMLKDRSYYYKATKADQPANDAITKFEWRMVVGTTFFKQDSEQFYTFINESMEKMDPYLNSLSRTQLINLCQALFSSNRSRSVGELLIFSRTGSRVYVASMNTVALSNYDRFFALPMIRKIMDLTEIPNFENFEDLNKYMHSEFSKYFESMYQTENNVYSDKLFNLISGRGVRVNAEKIISGGIKEKDYEQLFYFLRTCYPDGTQKEAFLREINKHYLRSPNVPMKDKIDYMLKHFDRLGPEAMLIIADQIQNIEAYRYFRKKVEEKLTAYLDSRELKATNIAAAIDLFSSFFTTHFGELLETCQDDPRVNERLSTEFAGKWFQKMLYPDIRTSPPIAYEPSLKKFVLTETGRETFSTLSDLFSNLHGLSEWQKFAIIHKSLTDKGGALTSTSNKERLASILTKSLSLKKGFMASALTAACTEADAKLIGFPASIMMAPLIFRALDIKAVKLDELKLTRIWNGRDYVDVDLDTILTEESIIDILRSDTRSVSVFGARYQNQPDSPVALLAQESDRQFNTTTDLLTKLLNSGNVQSAERLQENEIDPATEAIIRGVETSGALGIRALQLATQFYSFPPALENRLSETFDANPGLNKLLFWENLNKLALDKAEKGDVSTEEYLQRITLGTYLGGGSLQTTYAAILDTGTPEERQVIVKLKNPNVQKFIEESYLSATRTLEKVVHQGGSAAQHARTGLILMDLSQKWCLDDLNDKTFIEDDEAFRKVITGFNQKEGTAIFYAPEKVFTSPQMKSEDLASGKTANQFLKDPSVDFAQKQEVVRALSRFFIHQLKGQAHIEEGGKKLRLIHSDPHIGNYIVDTTQNEPKIGVIDRSMYLKLEDADIKVLEKLMLPGNDSDFVYGFIDRVLNINKVRGMQRNIVTGYVMLAMGAEYRRQQTKGHINRFDLMRTMISTLSDARLFGRFSLKRMDIPLNLRLMIRNIGAIQELGKRYGVDFNALYREST